MAITYAEFLETYTTIERAAIKLVECFNIPDYIVEKQVVFGSTKVEVLLYDNNKLLCGKFVFTIDNQTLKFKHLICQEIFK